MQTNPAVEQNKNIKWYESPWNQSGRKGKGLWRRTWFAEEPSLKFRVKDRTSKRRCNWWSWRWWRRWWWTAMCDRWKWRRLCLTRLTKISLKINYKLAEFWSNSSPKHACLLLEITRNQHCYAINPALLCLIPHCCRSNVMRYAKI